MATFSAQEQLMLELVNRARLDPNAEAKRLGITLNQGIAAGSITAAAKQPLAGNTLLNDAARAHSQWMIDHDVFDHTGAGGTSPFQRMTTAGYTGFTAAGENIAFRGTTGTLPFTNFVAMQHDDLFLSVHGHRENILEPGFREIGIGAMTGVFSDGTGDYNSVLTTQDFGTRSSNPIVTGVAYDDSGTELDRLTDERNDLLGIPVHHVPTRAVVWRHGEGLDHQGHSPSLAGALQPCHMGKALVVELLTARQEQEVDDDASRVDSPLVIVNTISYIDRICLRGSIISRIQTMPEMIATSLTLNARAGALNRSQENFPWRRKLLPRRPPRRRPLPRSRPRRLLPRKPPRSLPKRLPQRRVRPVLEKQPPSAPPGARRLPLPPRPRLSRPPLVRWTTARNEVGPS